MNSLSRTLSAAFAVAWSAALWATPTSSWVNFSGGTTANGITTYTGTNSAYTIKVTGGTKAADGSYIQLGTPAQAATETEAEVPATTGTGSLELTFPATFGSGKKFTIIADIEAASFKDVGTARAELSRVLEVSLNGGAVISVRAVSESDGTKMQTGWYDGTAATESWRTAKLSWTPANRQIVAFTYKGDSNATDKGFAMYRQESGADMGRTADSNLFSGASDVEKIVFGKNATGMKIYSFHVYETNLNSESVTGVATHAIGVLEREAEAQKKLAEVSTSANWTTLSWKNALTDTAVDAPTAADTVGLKAASGANTLTLNNTTAVTVADLVTTGAGSLAISGDGSLSATATCINTNTDITAATNLSLLSLGAVTIGAGNELKVDGDNYPSDIAMGEMNISGYGTLNLALGKGTVRNITGSNTAKPFGIKLSSGILNFSAGSEGNGPGKGRAITVTGSNSVLRLSAQDATGWYTASGQSLTIADGAKMEVSARDSFTTPLTLRKGTIELQAGAAGSEIRGFDWWQSAALTVAAVPGEEGVAESVITYNKTATNISDADKKFAARRGPLNVFVEANARLLMETPIVSVSGTAISKQGPGEWVITAAGTHALPVTVSAGTLKLAEDGTLSTGAVTVASGAVLEVDVAADASKTLANNISSDGTVKKSGAGELALTGAVSTPVELAAGTLNLGTLRPAVTVTGTSAVLKLTATPEEASAGAITLPAISGSGMGSLTVTVSDTFGTTQSGSVSDDGTRVTFTPTALARTLSGGTVNWNAVGEWTSATAAAPAAGVPAVLTLTADTTVVLPAAADFVAPGEVKVNGAYKLTFQLPESGNTPVFTANLVATDANTTIAAPYSAIAPAKITGACQVVVLIAENLSTSTFNISLTPASSGNFKIETLAGKTLSLTQTNEVSPYAKFAGIGGAGKVSASCTLNFESAFDGKTIELFGDITFNRDEAGINAGHGGTKTRMTIRQTAGTVSGGRIRTAAFQEGKGHGCTYIIDGGTCATKMLKYFATDTGDFTIQVNAGGTLSGSLKLGEGTGNTHKVILNGGKFTSTTMEANATVEVKSGTYTIGGTGDGAIRVLPESTKLVLTNGGSLTIAATQTLSGAISGTGALTIGDGTTAATVTLKAANTYSGGTTVKDKANLTLNKSATFDSDKTERSFSDGHNVALKKGSTLTLAAGAGFYNVTGDGKVVVSGDYYFGFSNGGGKLVADTLEVAANATLYTRGFSQYTPEANRAIQLNTLAVNGAIAQDVGDAGTEDLISLSVAKTLSGTGSIGVPLTLENGATLDASVGALTVTKDVTIAEGATVTVTPSATAATGSPILTCKNPAVIIRKLSATGRLLALDDETNPTKILLVVPAISLPAGSTGTLSDSAAEVVKALAAQNGLASASLSGTTKGGSAELDPAAMSAALELFSGITAVDADAQSIKVDYDFGIAKLEPTPYAVTVTVKIMHGDAAAALAEGAELSLVSVTSGTKIADMGAGFQPVTGTPGAYVGDFSLDSLKAGAFKVKAATKVTSTEGEATN